MAKIVSAYATSHILFSPKGVEEQAGRVVAGMKELGRRAAAAKPDVMLMIVSDHMFNMDLSVQVPFVVGVADRWVAFGDLGIPPRPFPGYRAFADGLVRFAAERGFDLAKAEEVVPDHGVALPLFFIEPWGSVPTVPLYVNINMDPVPSSARCLALAETIRAYVERSRPANERVAIVGSGGLSHWLRIPRSGTVAADFDQEVIETIAKGKGSRLAEMSTAELLEKSGNGGLEILYWMMMAVAAGEPKGERVYYEAIPQWQTGMGGISMHL